MCWLWDGRCGRVAGNAIGAASSAKLALELRNNTTLQSLNLSTNKIKDDGAGWIADALALNHCLLELNLERNLVGPDGSERLGAALVQNSTLQTLNMSRASLTLRAVLPWREKG